MKFAEDLTGSYMAETTYIHPNSFMCVCVQPTLETI